MDFDWKVILIIGLCVIDLNLIKSEVNIFVFLSHDLVIYILLC